MGFEGFDWVKARWQCSLPQIFQVLTEMVQSDVNAVNLLHRNNVMFTFSTPGTEKVVVTRARDLTGSNEVVSVVFELSANQITAREATKMGPKPPFLTATPTLNENGECVFDVGEHGPPLKLWQVSRKALENLFFGF
jgi:hypothetical protein